MREASPLVAWLLEQRIDVSFWRYRLFGLRLMAMLGANTVDVQPMVVVKFEYGDQVVFEEERDMGHCRVIGGSEGKQAL